MEKQFLTNAAAIKAVNEGKIIKCDMTDGITTIKRKTKGIYEIKVKTETGESVYQGTVQNLLKTLNRSISDGWYIE